MMSCKMEFFGDPKSIFAIDRGDYACIKIVMPNRVFGKGESLDNEVTIFCDDKELAKRIGTAANAAIADYRAELAGEMITSRRCPDRRRSGVTTMHGLTYDELRALNPCSGSLKRVAKLMGGATKWNGRKIDASAAREAGATFNDIIWAASAVARSDKDVERRLRLWMADCAARVLHIYENHAPADKRVRDAITAARAYARGEISYAARAAARDAARDAARAAGAAAGAAARAAARAAAWDADWDADWDARAAARAAAWDAAWTAEEAWQFDRLIARLGDDEPADWPLDAAE
jgi:hypothetical protein